MAVFLFALHTPLHAASVASSDALAKAAGTAGTGIEEHVAHEIAITLVQPGREGLELAAQLMEGGGIIERPVKWRVSDLEGGVLFDSETPTADISVAPGDYQVDIHYGAAHVARTLTLLPGNRLAVRFVLNVGGVRVLPQVKGIGLPEAQSHTRVYALAGLRQGQLIAESQMPGEILRVPAGEYRIESSFDLGNTVAVTDVKVSPGRLSAVQVDHVAGLARLAFVGAPDANVSWDVQNGSGEPMAHLSGLNATVVLKPGTYRASASTGRETLTATFAITEGEARDIILGN